VANIPGVQYDESLGVANCGHKLDPKPIRLMDLYNRPEVSLLESKSW
jgi:hypothetical protein